MHSAVRPRIDLSALCHAVARRQRLPLAVIITLLAASVAQAQPETAGGRNSDPQGRAVLRMGEGAPLREAQLDFTVPRPAGTAAARYRLPDAGHDQRLQELRSALAAQPGDEAARQALATFLDELLTVSDALRERGEFDTSLQYLEVIAAMQPGRAAVRKLQSETQAEQRLDRQVRAGQAALAAGRIDEPPNDSAWFYFRGVLDAAPDNSSAQKGLLEVQNRLIARAIDYAHELDFELADRVLEDASLVTESPERIAAARQEIRGFRTQRIAELEARAVTAMDEADFERAERLLVELVALGNANETVKQLRRRMEEARVYGGFRPGQVLRDHFLTRALWTPDSVVVLAGSFMMGSPTFEEGREESEGPEHRVTFRRGFAIGRTEVTVGQFREFVNQTDYRTEAEKHGFSTVYHHSSGRLARRDGVNWRNSYDGSEAKEDEPVLHVSWNDASAYVAWLARGTGKPYRLPSEAEFEYALRGGRSTCYWWGDAAPQRVVENFTGEQDVSRGRRQWSTHFKGYGDGFWGPAPAGSFEPNPFGLHDMAGNVGEWVRDCWHATYQRAPDDGSAWINPGCERRVIRGGYWASRPDQARSASRLSAQQDRRDARIGFRIARDL